MWMIEGDGCVMFFFQPRPVVHQSATLDRVSRAALSTISQQTRRHTVDVAVRNRAQPVAQESSVSSTRCDFALHALDCKSMKKHVRQ